VCSCGRDKITGYQWPPALGGLKEVTQAQVAVRRFPPILSAHNYVAQISVLGEAIGIIVRDAATGLWWMRCHSDVEHQVSPILRRGPGAATLDLLRRVGIAGIVGTQTMAPTRILSSAGEVLRKEE